MKQDDQSQLFGEDAGGPTGGDPSSLGGGGSGAASKAAETQAPGVALDDFPGATSDERLRVAAERLARERAAAQRAAEQARALADEVAALRQTLAQTREALDAAERRHQMDLLLIEAEAIDLESARLLTDIETTRGQGQGVARAIDQLKRTKPFLFRSHDAHRPSAARPFAAPSAAMSPAPRRGASELEGAAQDAARTGDRAALLRYLRARRDA